MCRSECFDFCVEKFCRSICAVVIEIVQDIGIMRIECCRNHIERFKARHLSLLWNIRIFAIPNLIPDCQTKSKLLNFTAISSNFIFHYAIFIIKQITRYSLKIKTIHYIFPFFRGQIIMLSPDYFNFLFL